MNEHDILYRYASKGRASGFEELVQRYEPLVYAAARRQVGDSHLAQDIAQATMMTLMRKAGKIRRRQPLGPWLLRVTHYLAIDALRSNSTRRRHERAAAQLRSECQEDISPWRSVAPILDSALHVLNDSDRTILTLRYLQDWPMEQIARELHATPIAVRQRLSRALRRLRKVLSERGIQRDELIPILSPLLVRLRERLGWLSHPLRSKGVAAILAMAILSGGLVLTHAAMRKTPLPSQNRSASPLSQPVNLRAQSTVP